MHIEFMVKTMKLNEKLSSLRKGKQMSQQDLADALNVSRQAVSRWEVGIATPSLDNLLALSKLFEVPVEEIMGADRGNDVLEREKVQDGKNMKRRYITKELLFILAAVVLISVMAITYLSQKKAEMGAENTVKFEELEKDDGISDSNTIKSGVVS